MPRSLKLFVSVAQRGSFASVAKDLDLDPSAVSRIIAALEDDLGIRLFQRTTRRMSLTEAGDLYLRRVEPLIEEMDRARVEALDVSAAPTGTLRISASVSFGQSMIVPLLPAFKARYPELKVDGIFTDANLDLVAERVDLAVRLAPTIEGDLIATRLKDTHYRVVASPAYLASAPPLTKPSELIHHRALLFTLRAFRSRWIFRDREGRIEEAPIKGDITLSPAGSLRDAALLGLGLALLPSWLVDEDIAVGRLVRLLPDHDVTATTFDTAVWLVYPSRAYLPNKVRVMIDFLKQSMG
ncbi:MAG: LysR substrate-binding domain-containing protein [Bosea sp. (in: a-proteobacteria)]